MQCAHLICNNCSKTVGFDSRKERKEYAEEHGWSASQYDEDALCPECKETCLILTYPDGERNTSRVVEVTAEGIEIEWIGDLDWEWIDAARAEVERRKNATAAN